MKAICYGTKVEVTNGFYTGHKGVALKEKLPNYLIEIDAYISTDLRRISIELPSEFLTVI